MKDISTFIANLSTEKRVEFLQKLKSGKKSSTTVEVEEVDIYEPLEDDCFYCSIEKAGNFNSIVFKEKMLLPPSADCVQIKVKAASLNFRDLMMAMNMYPPTDGVPLVMGSDYAGIITAVGEHVKNYAVGDEVFCLSAGSFLADDSLDPNSHFCSYLNIKEKQIAKKPSNITWEEAACIPTVFLTSYFALHQVANLKRNEKVLIHTATGGLGLAAIQVARWLGAEIFVTAGTEEKRKYLQAMGFAAPMDSRTNQFAEDILVRTQGKGVDVVLNTLGYDAANHGIKILRNFGRFLQIDKKDVFQNRNLALGDFKRGLMYAAIDLGLFYSSDEKIGMMTEIARHMEDGHIKPIAYTSYKVADLGLALTHFSRAQHIGKIVLTY